MRNRILLFAAIFSMLVAVPLAAGDSDADEPEEFTIGLFTYRIINDVRVSVIQYDNDHAEETVDIPDTVEHEGKEYIVTDLLCPLTSEAIRTVTIHSNLWNIPYPGIIREGRNIERFEVDSANFNLCSEDGILFDAKKSLVIAYPAGKTDGAYSLPNTVTVIGESAFAGVTGLFYLGMDQTALTEIRSMAFFGCTNLQYIDNIQGVNNLPTTLTIIDDGAFRDCTSLGTCRYPDNLRIIGEGTFENTAISSVTIPSRVIFIGPGAFASCGNLTEISTLSNTKYMAKDNILYETSEDMYYLHTYPAGRPDESLTLDSSLVSIVDYAFDGTKYLKKVILPPDAVMLPASSFAYCESLEEIDLGTIVVIENDAFLECKNLRKVTFGDSLSRIGPGAFSGCGLEEVVLPSSLTSLGFNSFSECMNLKRFTVSEFSKAEIQADVLLGCTALEDIYLLSSDLTLNERSLNVGTVDVTVHVTVHKQKGLSIPDNAVSDDQTVLNVVDVDERPYPYENFIGVAFCLIVLFMIIKLFRKV